jgi:hypothetical protein
MMARVSSRAVGKSRERSALRREIVGWTATLAFVAFSYALRRVLNRPVVGGAPR